MPLVMHDLLARFPHLSLQLREAPSAELLQMVHAGELDIAVGAGLPMTAATTVQVEPFLRNVMGVFVRFDHPLLQQEVQTMEHLLSTREWVFPEPLCAFPKSMLSDTPLLAAQRVVKAQSSSTIRWFARETDFLTLSTSLMLHTELNTGLVAQLVADWRFPNSEHVIYCRTVANEERPVEAAVAMLRAASCGSLAGRTGTVASHFKRPSGTKSRGSDRE